MIVTKAIGLTWSDTKRAVKHDLREYVEKEGSARLDRIRAFCYARWRLSYDETEAIIRELEREGSLTLVDWATWHAPKRRRRTGERNG